MKQIILFLGLAILVQKQMYLYNTYLGMLAFRINIRNCKICDWKLIMIRLVMFAMMDILIKKYLLLVFIQNIPLVFLPNCILGTQIFVVYALVEYKKKKRNLISFSL